MRTEYCRECSHRMVEEYHRSFMLCPRCGAEYSDAWLADNPDRRSGLWEYWHEVMAKADGSAEKHMGEVF